METKNAFVLAATVGLSMAANSQSGPSSVQSSTASKPRDICVLETSTLPSSIDLCTEAFINAEVYDGNFCYFKTCEVEEDSSCPSYFVKRKSAQPPESDYCSYHRPIEL